MEKIIAEVTMEIFLPIQEQMSISTVFVSTLVYAKLPII